MDTSIKIIIADDQRLFIEGLQSLLKDQPGIVVVDFAKDGKELLEILQRQHTDIVLLDHNMPKMKGLEAIKYIKWSYPDIKIIMLSTYNEEHLIEKAIALGANGYLLKDITKNELLNCINEVMNNNNHFPQKVTEANFIQLEKEDNFLKQYQLTKRETEIIQYIKKEYTNQQIADKLCLSIFTIETHRKNIMHKLGLKTPAALIKFIVENNM